MSKDVIEKEAPAEENVIVTDSGEETDLMGGNVSMPLETFEKMQTNLSRLSTAKAGLDMDGLYKEFELGESVRGFFLGFREIKKRQKNGDFLYMDAAFWLQLEEGSDNPQVMLNAGKGLVSKLERTAKGSPVEITLIAVEKVDAGNFNKFEVKPLYLESEGGQGE